MSNVLNFDVYKNTLKRRDGFSPVGGEYAYSKITCHFQEGDDWDDVHIVTAGFYVNAKHVVAVNAAIDNDNALTVSIPAQLLKKHEQIKFGLLGSVTADDEVVMTIATNVVSIDVARGIVSDALDEEAAEPGLYDRLLAALNEGLQNNIDYVDEQNAAQDAVIEGKADKSEIPDISGKADKTYVDSQNAAQDAVTATKADKTYVDSQNAAQNSVIEGKTSKVGIGSSDELIASTGSGNIKRSGYEVTNNSSAIKNTESAAKLIPTARAVGEVVDGIQNQIESKADKSEIPDISGKADKTYVDSQNTAQDAVIAEKANTDDVYSKVAAIGLFQLLAYKTDQLLNPELLNPTSYPSAKAVINLVAQKTVNTFDGENDEVLKYMSKEPQTDLDYVYSNVNTSLSERKDIPGAFSVVLPTFTHCVRIVDCQTGEEWKETAAEGTYEIRNLIPGRIYRYYVLKSDGAVLKSGSCTARGQVRMIDIPTLNGTRNVFNIRDLGGWACDGGVMKYGLVFRGGRLNGSNPGVSGSAIELTEQQIAYFKNVLHIADEIDLRTSNEISQDGISGSALGEAVSWINKTLGYYQNSLTDSTSANYAVLINRLAENLAAGKVTYIHCNSGADRTAQLCMFIEAICGVSLIDMERDYELTSYAFEYRSGQIDRRRNKITDACWKTLMQALDSETGSTIQEKAVSFLLRKGVTSSAISTIREKLVENSGGNTDISGKADKATTLAGYGITDAYTKNESDVKFFEFLDGTFAGDPNIIPTLLVDNTIDATYNPNGHYILYYIDSDGGRHNLFDFTYLPFLTQHQDISGKFDKSKIVKRAREQGELAEDTVFSTQATSDYVSNLFSTYNLEVIDLIKIWGDCVFADSQYASFVYQMFKIDNTVDQTYNPNGHYILYYIDSDSGRHNLFDFSNYFAEKAAVPSKTSQLTNDSGFLTSHQSLANYYNKTDVNNLLAGKANASHTHSQYLTSADIANKADKSEIPDISGKADKATTYTKSEVDALVSAGVVPQYVIDESESVLAKAFSHTGLGRTVRFIAVSDGHNDATEVSHSYTRIANKHCGQAVKYIAERIPLDFVASLGDMTWAGVAHTTAQYQTDWLKADLQEMNLFLRDGFGGVPNIRVVGNHDQCATTGSGGAVSRLQNSGAYQLIGRYNAGTGDGLSNYGYYDIERAKLRVIYLNTSDTVSTSTEGTLLSVSQAQKNWLCETLIALNEKSDAAGWKILLMSHAPLDMNSGIAADILLPYTNGGSYGSYAFTNHSAKIIGNCHGHTHCYNVGYMSDKIRRFTIPNANFYDNNHYKNNASYAAWNEDTTYPKTENSRTDTSFSLVTVDLDSLTCYVDNYGAGYDREFSLDYKSEPAPVNLFDKTDADVVIGGRFNTSRAVAADQQETLVTGYIPATTADVLHVVTNKANNSTAYVGAAQLYDSGKNYIGIYISPKASQNAGISPKPTWAADYLSGDFDLSVGTNSGTNTGVAYIRFCLAYTDIDEIVITKG